ncbi:MAG: RimJ/RimL family protein N-acetyltransferase [Limisphaerales bacterium]|jgi:RimJ/RimL family protein N-acetyltransferase
MHLETKRLIFRSFTIEDLHEPAGDFVDLGYQYSKEVWGQGLGLEAAKSIREYGLSTLRITNM